MPEPNELDKDSPVIDEFAKQQDPYAVREPRGLNFHLEDIRRIEALGK